MVKKQPEKTAYIFIDTEKCKGCRYCISVCPHQIIGVANRVNQTGSTPVEVVPTKADLCVGCGACAVMCPDTAISVFATEGEVTLF